MENRPELFEEVRLYKTPKDRERYDNQANLFAIISTIEQLEKAYITDCITAKEYTDSCSNLLTQFRTAFKLIELDYKTVDDFVKKFRLDCRLAMVRIKEDKPITIKDDKGDSRKLIAQIVSLFITLMDKLKLGIQANDEIQPDLRELIDAMNKLSILPSNFDGKAKIQKWYNQFKEMNASDEIDSDQSRNLALDLEQAYYEFNNTI